MKEVLSMIILGNEKCLSTLVVVCFMILGKSYSADMIEDSENRIRITALEIVDIMNIRLDSPEHLVGYEEEYSAESPINLGHSARTLLKNNEPATDIQPNQQWRRILLKSCVAFYVALICKRIYSIDKIKFIDKLKEFFN